MLNRYIFLNILFFISPLFAQNYTLDLVIDESSKDYISSIKKETKSLFSSSDKVLYNIKICKEECEQYLDKKRKVLFFKSNKKHKKVAKNYIINYNFISSIYDENRVLRTTALAIYEVLKEKKYNSIYIENKSKIEQVSKYENENLKLINLEDVFTLAGKNNLEIKQNQNSIRLDDLNIDESKSLYRPQVDVYSNYIGIDKDRAQYSNGVNSQGTFDAGIKVKQLIYSNQVLQNIKIKKLLSKSTKDEVKALNDEIMYKATLIYLNIIKAKKANQIIKIKQDFIEQNLEFAKQRVNIGVQDRSDVFRWESELANVNIDLANSSKDLNSLKIELGNLLQISDEFRVYEYGMSSILFKLDNKDAIKFIADKRVQENFSNNIVHSHSRLKQLGFLKDVKQEELEMNKDSRYMPTIAFEGNAKKIIDRYGEGKDAIRAWDDEEYQAVLNLNIPLYEGGLKSTKIQKNQIELINLKLQYNNMKNLIVENVRKNFESLKRSYEKIKFAKISQESSKKNFELIQDKYKNGKENIISLLDAQDSYIISKLNLNISIIEYLSDLSSIYFFSGKIDILVDKEKKREVEEKILNIVRGIEK
ncbi:TolC family protein [Arcobacter sp. LA11]|uniref:TolC family protein n=1 Tax=Arcobacter sp. LA11 TaxID=1898176 RepID=UPI000933F9D2|nr:TolC family protein [Arcobacter sp. LA11]